MIVSKLLILNWKKREKRGFLVNVRFIFNNCALILEISEYRYI